MKNTILRCHGIKLLILTLVFAATFFPETLSLASGVSTKEAITKMSTSPDLVKLVYKGYNKGTLGPISIAPVSLVAHGTNQSAYLICLSGTELVLNQSTGLLTDLKSGFDQKSPYLLAVVKAINDNIPKNSKLILAGHSLGGMIAEQVSGTPAVKSNYTILNVITFGSPLVHPFGCEGTIKRLGDSSDVVPYLSAEGLLLLPWQIAGLEKENGGYTDPIKAHKESYFRNDVWGDYDVLGFEKGAAYILYNSSALKFYKAPIFH